jgi:hypothetical protein
VKAVPTVPFAVFALAITGGPAAMLSVSGAVPVPFALVALRVTVDVPDAVGVPKISPVVLFTVSPLGNPVAP